MSKPFSRRHWGLSKIFVVIQMTWLMLLTSPIYANDGTVIQQSWQEKFIPAWLQGDLLGLSKWQWIGLFLAIFLGLILKTLTEAIVSTFKKALGQQEETLRYHTIVAVEKPIGLVVATLFWYICIHLLRFEGTALKFLLYSVQILLSLNVIWVSYRLSSVLTVMLHRLALRTESELDDQLVPMLAKSIRVFIVIVGILVALQNLGYDVTSLIAGLGIGGLAFALAAKDTIANFFGSIMILIDRPFKIGDWIKTKSAEGSVEEIGFRSTRIRTFYNSLVSIPNSVLVNENIDNMGMRVYRRVRTTLGITYDTPPEKIEAFCEGIKHIIRCNEYTRKDYFHVVFEGYGDFSLNVLVYFFLQVEDWSKELVERQNIYLEIYRLAQSLGVTFAFPTQTLHIESFPEKSNTL